MTTSSHPAACSCSHTVGIGGQQKHARNHVRRMVRHHSSARALTNRPARYSHSASWDRPDRPRTLVETCTLRYAQSVEALGENTLKGVGERRTLRDHSETKRLAVVGPGRDSEERFLKRTTSWLNTNVASRGLLMLFRPSSPLTCVIWTVPLDNVTVTNQSTKYMRSLLGVLGYLAMTDLPCRKLSRTSREKSPVQHVEHWLEHDVLCGTSCASRISHGHSQQEPSWSILTCTLKVIWAVKETERKSSSCVVIRLGESVLKRAQRRKVHSPVSKQSCTEQLERQHAVSNSSNSPQKSVDFFHSVYIAIQPQLAA